MQFSSLTFLKFLKFLDFWNLLFSTGKIYNIFLFLKCHFQFLTNNKLIYKLKTLIPLQPSQSVIYLSGSSPIGAGSVGGLLTLCCHLKTVPPLLVVVISDIPYTEIPFQFLNTLVSDSKKNVILSDSICIELVIYIYGPSNTTASQFLHLFLCDLFCTLP